MELDDILNQLGSFGSYQKRNYFYVSLIIIFSVFPMSYIFTARNINYRCFIDECDRNVNGNNIYEPDWIANAVPYKNNIPSKCLRYKYNFENITVNNDTNCKSEYFDKNVTINNCERFVYDNDKITIAQDFDVMCDENLWKLTLVGTINCIGELMCLPFSGYISDKYGRKAMMIVSVLLSTIAGLIKSLTPNYISYVIMEFLDTAIGSGMYSAAYILAIELVSPEKRVLGNTIMAVAFAIGEALLGFAAWCTPSWRIMLRLLYTPGFIFISYIWLMQESVRWLISKGRYNKVKKVLFKVARHNGKQVTDNILQRLDIIQNDVDREQTESIKDVLKCAPLFLRLINCSFSWICCTFVYYGLTMHSVSITGDPYINYIAVAFIEIPAYFVTYFVLDSIGRRVTLSSSLLISGIACVCFIFVNEDIYVGRLILFLLGKFAVTISYTVLYMYTTEMFPTSLRHSLLSICSMFGRLGSMVAPQVPLLATISTSLPLIMFGAMASSSGLLALAFPETHNTKLPDTIKDALHIGTSIH